MWLPDFWKWIAREYDGEQEKEIGGNLGRNDKK